jgi:hypothetical protein
VLDGAIDPAEPVIARIDEQSASLDAQLQQFFANCAHRTSCGWQPGENLTTAFETLLARVRADPLPAQHTDRTVGPAELLNGTASALYWPFLWPDLEQALQEATHGDGTGLLALLDGYTGRHRDGSYDNLFEALPAVNCLDTPAPSLAALRAAVPAAEAAAPVFGVDNLYGEAQCAVWPIPPTGRIGPVRAAGSPPIVVVGSTGDPITPYHWAQSLSQELANGVLLTRIGDGHTAYPFSSCIRSQVDRYLLTRSTPPAGTRCPTD